MTANDPFYWTRPLNLWEIMAELENLSDGEDTPAGVIITLPPPTYDTDYDSGDEICNDADRLNKNQLQSMGEVEIDNEEAYDIEEIICSDTQFLNHSNVDKDHEIFEKLDEIVECQILDGSLIGISENITLPFDVEESNEDNNLATETTTEKQVPFSNINKYRPQWIAGGDRNIELLKNDEFQGAKLPHLTLTCDSHPIDFFFLFFSKDIAEYIVKESNNYATQKGIILNMQEEEFYVVLGILFLSGYNSVPRRRMYWEMITDTQNQLVSNSMRRNRFDLIFQNLHFINNESIDFSDRLSKVRPLITLMNELFLSYAPMEHNLSIDESMIPYFGKNSLKQFIATKPIRFGYKAWVVAQRLGYCLQFDIYQGKNPNKNLSIGVGESVIINFAGILKTRFPELHFSLFFDNYFTGSTLVAELTKECFGATGTIRENRVLDSQIEHSKTFKKKGRGTIQSAVDSNSNMIIVRWKDNNVVTFLSNKFGCDPSAKVSRYSRADKKYKDIVQPDVGKAYNNYMGGVDQMDNAIAAYRINIRNNRCYFPIVLWVFDVAMNNAWMLARAFGCVLDNLEFRRQIATELLTRYGQASDRKKKVSSTNNPKRTGSHPISIQTKRMRCTLCNSQNV